MESNSNDTFGSQNTGSGTTGGSYGASTGSQAGSQGGSQGTGSSGGSSNGGSTGGAGGFSRENATEQAGELADRAKSAASSAGDKLADVGSTVRDRAGNLKTTIADALESGAERLRQQGAGGGQIAGSAATGGSAGMLADTPQLGAAANQLAGGLQASADWLRDADIDGLKSGIERQVKEHPGRTLAVAVGLGYLLGKALRK
ncbi:MAG: hypothetical protein JWN79_479 [Gemmatimonadetes bacterium]|jgi:ElaB/YqjD/DUF883 family membrane-anchored ribosome-binding protein|nr:hypothetical protein [Gemmatimonadota bacterium]